jgi:hypothetical protein
MMMLEDWNFVKYDGVHGYLLLVVEVTMIDVFDLLLLMMEKLMIIMKVVEQETFEINKIDN